MATIEKEKAIDVVKQMVADGQVSQEVAEKYFPELTGSEDEKVRKALIEMVHDTTGDELWVDYNVHKEEALAWLEKQGEQKSIVEMKTPEESLGIDSDTYNKIVDECIYGEQKPAETEKGAKGNDREIHFSGQEWSEEDEKILNLIITRLHSHPNVEAEEYGKDYHWLKSLKDRVQLQQKQEWSEEDYNEIETIACHLDNTDNEGLAEVLRNIRNKYYHIIPQSTWKPSDEQIKALERECMAHSNYDLCRLCEQLKKLREE